MIEIILKNGYNTFIDKEDFKIICDYKWSTHNMHGKYYAEASIGKKKIMMHRLIMNAPNGVEVDHIDGNSLNNTRKNLRLCNRAQNSANKKKKSNCTSKYPLGIF